MAQAAADELLRKDGVRDRYIASFIDAPANKLEVAGAPTDITLLRIYTGLDEFMLGADLAGINDRQCYMLVRKAVERWPEGAAAITDLEKRQKKFSSKAARQELLDLLGIFGDLALQRPEPVPGEPLRDFIRDVAAHATRKLGAKFADDDEALAYVKLLVQRCWPAQTHRIVKACATWTDMMELDKPLLSELASNFGGTAQATRAAPSKAPRAMLVAKVDEDDQSLAMSTGMDRDAPPCLACGGVHWYRDCPHIAATRARLGLDTRRLKLGCALCDSTEHSVKACQLAIGKQAASSSSSSSSASGKKQSKQGQSMKNGSKSSNYSESTSAASTSVPTQSPRAVPPPPSASNGLLRVVLTLAGGAQVTALFDTGASNSLMTKEAAERAKLEIYKLPPGTKFPLTASGEPLELVGYVHMPVEVGGVPLFITAYVAPSLSVPLLVGAADLWRKPGTPMVVERTNAGVFLKFGDGEPVRVQSRTAGQASHVVWQARTAPPGGSKTTLSLGGRADSDGNVWLVDDHQSSSSCDVMIAMMTDSKGKDYSVCMMGDGLLNYASADKNAKRTGRPTKRERQAAHLALAAAYSGQGGGGVEPIGRPEEPKAYRLPNLSADAPAISTDERPTGADKDAYLKVNINPKLPAKDIAAIKAVLREFKSVFGGTDGAGAGKAPPLMRGVVHRIVLRHDADLSKISSAVRRQTSAAEAEIKSLVEKLEQQKRLRDSNSPLSSGIVVVPKRDQTGKTVGMRVAVDLRQLNDQTLPDNYPMQQADSIAEFISGYEYRSVLDCWSQYWQIPLDEHSARLTATRFGPGVFKDWLVAPFGLRTMPATIQRVMDRTFCAENERTYFDDLGMGHKTTAGIAAELRSALQRAAARGVTFKATKCYIGFAELPMIGYQIGYQTRSPILDKLKPWLEYGTPKDAKALETFLHGTLYYQRFVPDYSELVGPLREIVKPGRFKWEPQHDRAFKSLKMRLQHAVGLAPFDPKLELILDTDYCNFGIGWVLSQKHKDGVERPVAVGSQKLCDAETRYPPTKGELLALRRAVGKLTHLLSGRHFYWRTDHMPLMTVNNKESSTSAWLRHTLAELQEYHFTPVHRKGKEHTNADTLSRDPRFLPAKSAKHAKYTVGEPADGICLLAQWLDAEDAQYAAAETDMVALAAHEAPMDATAALRQASTIAELPLEKLLRLQRDDPALAALWKAADGMSLEALGAKDKAAVLATAPFADQARAGVLCISTDDGQRMVVPAGAVQAILHNFHSASSAGHFNGAACLQRLRKSFWWPSMTTDTLRFAHDCVTCTRARQQRVPGNLGATPTNVGKCTTWQLDMMGPYSTPVAANQYIFSAVDVATGWIELCALPDKSAGRVLDAYRVMVDNRHGTPMEIVCDNGKEFDNGFFKAHLKQTATKLTFTSAYDPRARGMVERAHRTVGASLAKNITVSDHPFALLVSNAMRAVNSYESRSRGVSPAYAMYGQELATPAEILFELPAPGLKSGSPAAIAAKTVRATGDALREANRLRLEDQERNRVAYEDRNGPPVDFQPGNSVWVYTPARTKLEARADSWRGPYLIHTVSESGLSVTLASQTGKISTQKISIRRLRFFENPLDNQLMIPVLDSDDNFTIEQDKDNFPWLGPLSDRSQLQEESRRRLNLQGASLVPLVPATASAAAPASAAPPAALEQPVTLSKSAKAKAKKAAKQTASVASGSSVPVGPASVVDSAPPAVLVPSLAQVPVMSPESPRASVPVSSATPQRPARPVVAPSSASAPVSVELPSQPVSASPAVSIPAPSRPAVLDAKGEPYRSTAADRAARYSARSASSALTSFFSRFA